MLIDVLIIQTLLNHAIWLQIFPINIKGVAGSLATLVNWFGAWAVSYTFNFLMSWSSFILYAAINAGAILFVVTLVLVLVEQNGSVSYSMRLSKTCTYAVTDHGPTSRTVLHPLFLMELIAFNTKDLMSTWKKYHYLLFR